MEKTHFPGYGRCTACEEIISEKEIRNHILNCRNKPSNENKLCQFCNKQIDSKQFQQHIDICKQKQNILSKKQCPFCHKFIEDLASHCVICENDENNNTGYETPRAQTPIQVCILFS